MGQTILIPIKNLKLYRRLQIGNVLFVPSPVHVKDKRLAKLMKKIMSAKKGNMRSERYLSEREKFEKHSVAIVEASKDSDNQAQEEAEKVVERSLNVLRFYLSYLSENDPIFYSMYMGREGTTFTGLTAVIGLRSDGTSHFNIKRVGHVFGFEIDKNVMRLIKKSQFDKLNKLLLKPEERQSPFEKSLLTSIDFYGYAMNEYNRRNKFISFMISLESLVLDRRENKGELAERVALILADSVSEREKIAKRIQELYDVRSDIVHEGKDAVKEADLRHISEIAYHVVLTLVTMAGKINDKKTLKNSLRVLKFSAPKFKL